MNYEQPHDVDNVKVAFPVELGTLLPPYTDIPEEFRDMNSRSPWHRFQAKWFYEGLDPDEVPEAKPGIDQAKALRHLQVIQRSFEPKHEHKMAAVAWLASKWLQEPKLK